MKKKLFQGSSSPDKYMVHYKIRSRFQNGKRVSNPKFKLSVVTVRNKVKGNDSGRKLKETLIRIYGKEDIRFRIKKNPFHKIKRRSKK